MLNNFTGLTYIFQDLNFILLCCQATDSDLGDNGTVEYSERQINPEFDIDVDTGLIYTTDEFTTDLVTQRGGQYQYEITARDKGTPPKSKETSVKVCHFSFLYF